MSEKKFEVYRNKFYYASKWGRYLKYNNKIVSSQMLKNIFDVDNFIKFIREFNISFDGQFDCEFETLEEAQRCCNELNDKYLCMFELIKEV